MGVMTVYDAGSVGDMSGLSLDDVMRAGLETVRGQLGDEGSDLVVERLRQLDLVGMPGGVDSRWLPLGRVADWGEQGPSLDQVLRRSQEIRDQVNLGSLLKRGSELRSEQTFSDPITFRGLPEPKQGRPAAGVDARVQEYVDLPVNQKYVFSPEARIRREVALFTNGNVFYLFNKNTKVGVPVPIWEISDILRNPDDPAEVWAYRRKWLSYANPKNPVEQVRWYYTDLFADKRGDARVVDYGGTEEPIGTDYVIFDMKVNQQIGHAWGWPDGGAAVEWAAAYVNYIKNGMLASEAMTRYLFKVSTPTKTGGEKAAATVSGSRGAGQTFVGSGGADISALSTAGRGFDFASGRALAAMVATSIGVSVVSLTSSPADAGSSYGAGQLLDLPTRLSTEVRRQLHCEFEKRILRWMGAPDANVVFDGTLVDANSIKNELQALVLANNTGLFEPGEVRPKVAKAVGLQLLQKDAPEGYMIPNNEKWMQSSTADDDGMGAANTGNGGDTGTSTQTGASQGQSTGVTDDNSDEGEPDSRGA